MMEPHVILVNERDEAQGTIAKMEAHRRGLLHRAFSVFIFNREGAMLLQQRAAGKYHGGGLWTNACCSHPLPGERVTEAASRRLGEELGIVVPIEPVLSFTYRADVENGLVEHEFDHVFAGTYDGPFDLDPEEVAAVRYVAPALLEAEMARQPDRFTAWFKMIYPRVAKWRKENASL